MRSLILSILMCGVIAQSTVAQEAPLGMIPASAAVVIRLQAPETAAGDLRAFLNKVQPGIGDLAGAQLPSALGQMISNPALAGVDQSRDWYFAVFVDGLGPPENVLLLPAADVAELKKAMGPEYEFVEKDGWLACSTEDRYHDAFEQCVSGAVESIAARIDERTTSALMSGHLGVVVNAAVLRESFAEELDSAEERLEGLIQIIAQQLRNASPGMDMDYVFDIYRDAGKFLLQGVRDSTSMALSVKVTDSTLQIEHLLSVTADTATDAFFQTQPVNDLARLTTVPEGMAGYVAIHGNPLVLLDWSERLVSRMLSDEEQQEKMAKSIAIMRQAKFGAIAGGGDLLPDKDPALRYYAVSEISPPSVMAETMQLFATGIDYDIAGIQVSSTLQTDAESIDGQSISIFQMEQTIPPELDPTGMQKALNEKLYGTDGIVQRIALKDDLVLQTMGGGTESMKRLLTSTGWSDPKLLEARARQHEQANLLILVDVPNSVLKFAKLILGTGAVPVPVQPEQLDDLVISPSYAGFSLAVEKQRLSARTSIPLETFQGFVQIGQFIQQLTGQAR